jgi:hypothetical protein
VTWNCISDVVLCEHETSLIKFRDEHRLRNFENRMLRKRVLSRKEIEGENFIMRNRGLHNKR